MKKLTSMILIAMMAIVTGQAFAGNCQHSSDRAADGSRCGGRAADERPGGQ